MLFYVFICWVFFSKEEQSHYDSREEWCLWKEIDAIDFNIDTKKCFETKISACQKSTYVSIEECNKLNGL